MPPQLSISEIKQLIMQELPRLIKKDKEFRFYILDITRGTYADKKETEDKFEKLILQIEKKREEDNKKWAEQEKKWAEQNKKWWEHHEEDKIKWEEHLKEDRKMWEEHLKEDKKKWQENQKNIENILKRIDDVQKKQEQSFGAIGARWGIHTEASFRNALKGILEDTHSGYNVINYNEFDEEGIVFDRPDQVEIDVIVKNGKTYIIEIKSSVSKADISVFIRKVRFFKKKHEQKVYKNIIVSPMIDENAREFAKSAGIKLYSYVENIDL